MTDCKKLLLVAWPAADWKILLSLLDEGRLPQLNRLIEAGVISKMTSVHPNQPPTAWTSVSTGKEPLGHRVLGTAEPFPDGQGARSTTCLGRRGKTLWNILCQNHWRCQLVGWPATHPAEPLQDGVVASDWFPRVIRGPEGTWPLINGSVAPEALAQKFAELRMHPAEITGFDLLPFVPKLTEMEVADDPRLTQLAGALAESVSLHAAAMELMDTRPWDFHAVYYPAIHHISQLFINYHPPKPDFVSDDDFEMFQHVVQAAYVFHDQMLGALVERAGDDATVVVLSDRGYHSGEHRHNAPLDEPGAPPEQKEAGTFILSGSGIRKDQLIFGTSVLDVTPTLLHHCGLAVGEDMDGRVLMSVFESSRDPALIASWDDLAGADGRHPEDLRYDPIEMRPARDENEPAWRAAIELRYNLAESCIACHREAAAIELLEGAWSDDPEDTRYAYQLMTCYMAIGRPDDARRSFNHLLDNKKRYAPAALAAWRELEARDPDTLTDGDRALKLKLWKQSRSNLSGMGFLQAWLLHAEGDPKAALKVITLTDERKVHNLVGLLKLKADCQFQMESYDEARAIYESILKLDRESPDVYLGLSKTFYKQKRYREAAANAKTAFTLRYWNPIAHYVYGSSMFRCGQPAAAADALEVAISQAPRLIGAYPRLALLYDVHLGDPEKADYYMDELKKAKELQSEFEERRRSPLDGNSN